ncbi:hypothetical protein CTI12_AA015630 [Artemisia annua]|uniref:Uncharacterized protein n=1 Tax=Artemisia annua TaxID=35608 RepID=A0A2U1QL38_ARTAN|nr:hypothetical protein CTI12_AA015630 [Artemisia annua]
MRPGFVPETQNVTDDQHGVISGESVHVSDTMPLVTPVCRNPGRNKRSSGTEVTHERCRVVKQHEHGGHMSLSFDLIPETENVNTKHCFNDNVKNISL